MKKSLSLLIVLSALNKNLFADEAGMPQLDPTYWASQAFWLILIFTILYVSISKFYLPKIKENLHNRENKIKEDIDNASKFKKQSEVRQKEYELILKNAKKEVSKIHFESKNILKKNIEEKKRDIEQQIDKDIAKTQKEIIDLKENSLSAIQNISENIASNIIENISGDKLNESSIKATVDDITKKSIGKYL